jgi:hypothetical protein
MPKGKGYAAKMKGSDPKVKGAKMKKNVTKSAGYKQDKKTRKKDYKSGGFKFGKVSNTGPAENVRASANASMASTGTGKNDAQVRKAISKLSKGKAGYQRKAAKATLGNKPIVVKKKKVTR